MKQLLIELKRRFLNRGTLVAVSSYIISQLINAHVIPTQELGDAIATTIDYGLYALVLAGFLNNAGIGKGFKDK